MFSNHVKSQRRQDSLLLFLSRDSRQSPGLTVKVLQSFNYRLNLAGAVFTLGAFFTVTAAYNDYTVAKGQPGSSREALSLISTESWRLFLCHVYFCPEHGFCYSQALQMVDSSPLIAHMNFGQGLYLFS